MLSQIIRPAMLPGIPVGRRKGHVRSFIAGNALKTSNFQNLRVFTSLDIDN
jgi:hypothetical protein